MREFARSRRAAASARFGQSLRRVPRRPSALLGTDGCRLHRGSWPPYRHAPWALPAPRFLDRSLMIWPTVRDLMTYEQFASPSKLSASRARAGPVRAVSTPLSHPRPRSRRCGAAAQRASPHCASSSSPPSLRLRHCASVHSPPPSGRRIPARAAQRRRDRGGGQPSRQFGLRRSRAEHYRALRQWSSSGT